MRWACRARVSRHGLHARFWHDGIAPSPMPQSPCPTTSGVQLPTRFRSTTAVEQHFKDIEHDPDRAGRDLREQPGPRAYADSDGYWPTSAGGFVIGTGDLSELALGWATYNGDHMSDVRRERERARRRLCAIWCAMRLMSLAGVLRRGLARHPRYAGHLPSFCRPRATARLRRRPRIWWARTSCTTTSSTTCCVLALTPGKIYRMALQELRRASTTPRPSTRG